MEPIEGNMLTKHKEIEEKIEDHLLNLSSGILLWEEVSTRLKQDFKEEEKESFFETIKEVFRDRHLIHHLLV